MRTIFYAALVVFGVMQQLHGTNAGRCDGLPGGTLLRYDDPAQCNRFYACQHETDHEWYCPPGEFFNQRNQQCEASCNTADANQWCVGLPDMFIRLPPTEPADCTKYYTCFGGQMFLNTCPGGLLFSQLRQACASFPDEC
ncbi:peritrophin-1-like [Anopheles albimanus]|uniref:Chitin-binding type-2 domain-containing protein n=1 Tax=Anopheles albimanus TaxID=7167 RepID=A0A182FBU5_ANOAL|nr:peritrophin-1-like [Anopheles albimanus]